MSDITDLWLFIVAGLLLNISPGPDMALVMARAASHGVRGGAVAALGVGAGALVHIAAAGIGLSAILATSAAAFTVVKLAGAAYLIWIGLKLICARAPATQEEAKQNPTVTSLGTIFVQGMVTNVLNPKIALFFLAFLPQFIAQGASSTTTSFLILGLIFNVNGTIINLLVAWIAARAARAFGPASAARLWIERTLGALFLGLGVRLAFLQRAT